MILIVHKVQWVLLCFLDFKHYFFKKWASSERRKRSTNYSRKNEGTEINKLNVWLFKDFLVFQDYNISFKVRLNFADTL